MLGDETLKTIARGLMATVRKYGCPPHKQEKATLTVLEQAEVLSEGWVVG